MKLKLSKTSKKLIALSLVLTLIITFGLPWFLEGRTGASSSQISLSFEGIGNGLDPKGNHFDINEIKSEEVLKRAIDSAGLEDQINTEQLRKMIVIEPLAGSNALGELTKMSTTSAKTKSIIEKSINTGDYRITVKEIGLIPNPLESLKISKAIAKEYKKYFKEAYLVDSTISSPYEKEDIFALDHPEMMLVMKQDSDSLVRYIGGFVNSSPDFISQKTGLTFADLEAQAEVIRDKEIGSAANIVDYYVLTKSGSDRIAYENIKMKRANLSLKKSDGVVSRVGYILNSYDNSSNYIVPSEDAGDLVGTQENEFYGNLMDQLVASKNTAINAKYNVAEIQKHLDKLSQSNEQIDKSKLAKSVETDAKQAYERMEKLREQVKVLAQENYDLNIGSKISISKAGYKVNTWGNFLANFIMLLMLLNITRFIFFFFKSKGKNYFKEVVGLRIKKHYEKLVKN